MGCCILREDNKEQKRHRTLLVHGKHSDINKRENLKGAVEILEYVGHVLWRRLILVQGEQIKTWKKEEKTPKI